MSIEMSIVAAIIIIGTAKVAGWVMRFLSWLEGEPCRVVSINERHHHFTVEFDFPEGSFRETYKEE